MAKGRNKNGTFAKGNKCAEKWTEAEAIKLGDELLEWMFSRNDRCWFQDFFTYEKKMGYKSLVCYLTEKFQPFSERIELAKQIQESRLFHGGLTNEFNSKIASMGLNIIHDWHEKSITEVEQKDDTEQDINITVNIVDDNRDKVEINRQGTDK